VRDPVAADGREALRARLRQAARLGQADVAAQAALLLRDVGAFSYDASGAAETWPEAQHTALQTLY